MTGQLPQEMEQLLAELQTEGRLDSTGVFTLDFVKGADKLRQYQLAEPALYLPKLVQSAVAAGAASIQVVTSGTTLQFSFDGEGLQPAELEGLVTCLLDPLRFSDRRQLVHLAVGLNSCLGCGVDQIVVESWNGEEGAALVLTDQLQQTGRVVGKSRRPGTRIFLRKRGLPLPHLFRAESEALQNRATFCPVPVRLNGSDVSHGRFGSPALPPLLRPFQPLLKFANQANRFFTESFLSAHRASLNSLGRESDPVMPWWVLIWNVEDYVFGQCHRNHHLLERRWLTEAGPAALALQPNPPASLLEREGTPTLGPRTFCSRVLALEADLKAEARLYFVSDGVLLCCKHEGLGYSGAVGLLSAEGLTTDLSQFGLVENDAYRKLLADLKLEFKVLTAELRDRLNQDHTLTPLGKHVRSRLRR